MIFILVGPPGCGKGTQADLLVKKHDFTKISTGDLLRKEIASGSDLGKQVDQVISSGNLVSDELVTELLKKTLAKTGNSRYLLDGFPRTVEQARLLDDAMESTSIKGVIHLDVSEEVVLQRITGRYSCVGCGAVYHSSHDRKEVESLTCSVCGSSLSVRSDDTPDKVRVRLEVYEKSTVPVVEYYKKKGCYQRIDANKDRSEVSENVCSIVKSLL